MDHPRNAHDDQAMAAIGSLLLAANQSNADTRAIGRTMKSRTPYGITIPTQLLCRSGRRRGTCHRGLPGAPISRTTRERFETTTPLPNGESIMAKRHIVHGVPMHHHQRPSTPVKSVRYSDGINPYGMLAKSAGSRGVTLDSAQAKGSHDDHPVKERS